KSQIQEGDVRLLLPEHLNGITASSCLSHHLHVWLVVDDDSKPLAEQGMVIYTEDADGGLGAHFLSSLLFVMSDRAFRTDQFVNHLRGFLEIRLWKAIWLGTNNSTSVPLVVQGRTLSRAPILSACSRISESPLLPSHLDRNT